MIDPAHTMTGLFYEGWPGAIERHADGHQQAIQHRRGHVGVIIVPGQCLRRGMSQCMFCVLIPSDSRQRRAWAVAVSGDTPGTQDEQYNNAIAKFVVPRRTSAANNNNNMIIIYLNTQRRCSQQASSVIAVQCAAAAPAVIPPAGQCTKRCTLSSSVAHGRSLGAGAWRPERRRARRDAC